MSPLPLGVRPVTEAVGFEPHLQPLHTAKTLRKNRRAGAGIAPEESTIPAPDRAPVRVGHGCDGGI